MRSELDLVTLISCLVEPDISSSSPSKLLLRSNRSLISDISLSNSLSIKLSPPNPNSKSKSKSKSISKLSPKLLISISSPISRVG